MDELTAIEIIKRGNVGVSLMELVSAIPAGMACDVHRKVVERASYNSDPWKGGILGGGTIRQDDVQEYIEKIEENWSVVVTRNVNGNYTFFRPVSEPKSPESVQQEANSA